MKLVKFCFIALHSSVFGKVRELVGGIKYAFGIQIGYENWHTTQSDEKQCRLIREG